MPEDSGSSSRPNSPGQKSPDAKQGASGPRLPRFAVTLLLIGLAVAVIVNVSNGVSSTYKPMTLTEFQTHWDAKQQRYIGFDKAVIHDESIAVRASQPTVAAPNKDGPTVEDTKATHEVWYTIGYPQLALNQTMMDRLATIPDAQFDPGNRWVQLSFPMIVFGVFSLMIVYFLFRMMRGSVGPGNVLSFGRSKPRLILKDHTGVKFEDVAGIDEAKEEVGEVIEFLKNPGRFQKLGGRIPRGLLFVGQPGTGKTLLAKAIAGEADVPFYSICGSDFVEMFVGVGASRVRDLFRQAKENTPCIIFLDEVDAVGRKRGTGQGGGHDEREQTLNAILVEMDGFDTNEQVIVIASTNRPDVLDQALLRPGRFDREIVINLPDVKGRYEILKVHSRHVKMSQEIDLMRIARGTPMFSGADLEAIINEAAIIATMANKDAVDMDDLEEARDKVKFGRQKRSRVLDEHDRMVTAYHEAGHAMVTRLCPDVEPLHKVTIIPRGMALGTTMMLPDHDRYTVTRRNLLGQIKVLFGGRIAEALCCGDICSGASSDIERATEIARRMVCEFGMTEDLGPIRYSSKEQQLFLGGEIASPREYSETTAEHIDRSIRVLIDQCYADAERMLQENRDALDLVAKALLKHETLSAAEIEQILRAGSIDVIARSESTERAVAITDTMHGLGAETSLSNFP